MLDVANWWRVMLMAGCAGFGWSVGCWLFAMLRDAATPNKTG